MQESNFNSNYNIPKKIKPHIFYGNLVIFIIMLCGVILGLCMIAAKLGVGASIGNASLGIALGVFIILLPSYFLMDKEAKQIK